MKKILIGLVLLTILAAPLAALAADAPQSFCKLRRDISLDEGGGTDSVYTKGTIVGETGDACGNPSSGTCKTPNWGMLCLLNTFNGIIDWMFAILVILSVFFTILGAFRMITAGGKSENVTEGKNYILYAAIGLAVAFIARALPGVVKAIAGF